MCPAAAAVPRSRIGETDSGTRAKRTLKRCTKEDDAADGTRFSSEFMSDVEFESFTESPETFAPTSLEDTLRFLRTVRRHLGPLASPVPRNASSQNADKTHTGSPTKSHSRKFGPRKRTQSGLVESEPLHISTSKKSPKGSQGSEPLHVSSQNISTPLSQINASRQYAIEDLNMQIRCYEQHITTWDAPDHTFFIFPAQLLVTCTSKRDFDPLVVPDVSIVDIVCTTMAMGGPHNLHRPLSFSTFFDGAIIRHVNDEPKCHLTQGIHVEGVSPESWSSTMNEDGHFGWYMRFWIPIPFVLFQRAETRSFKIAVRVHVYGAEDQEGNLTASSDFTLTRLLRGLAM
ncbi:hypothetical protein K503DRAFT_865970 [Rhizopogon vinicolor AM-OR11-026]|uniref:Uncharacterized protein n=1 Tax=Rhizopogon vinicolor AM-OR11-026 TaxID=1314800 RepID=A0A1B7N1E9_9AGAM|nr:hypothetical protein K503DRAFT_865970 [Rhizopogon vinicolor AM-OR11-026]